MREGSIPESIARQLVGRKHATGEFVSYESRNGKFTVTSKCSNCSGPHANISIINANQAASNPSVPLINCQWCKRVIDAPQARTYEEVLRIPERQRTSAQDRIIVEHEYAERTAQRAAIKQAPINRAIKAAMWAQWEKYVMSLAHSLGQSFVNAPAVLADAAYISWEQWQSGTEEHRHNISAQVETYFQNNGLQW